MSLKATAKEFVPSFGLPEAGAAGTGPVVLNTNGTAASTTTRNTSYDDKTRSSTLAGAMKGLHLQDEPQSQQRQQHPSHGKQAQSGQKMTPTLGVNTPNNSRHDRIPAGKDSLQSKRRQQTQQQGHIQQQQQSSRPRTQQDQIGKKSSGSQAQPSSSDRQSAGGSGPRSGSQASRPSSKRQDRSSEDKPRPGHDRSKSSHHSDGGGGQAPTSAATTTTSSNIGSANATAAATSGQSRRSGSTSTKGTSGNAAQGKRKGSLDLSGPGSKPTSGPSASSSAASAAASSISTTATGATGVVSTIIPGMEPTAFICLTDVIQPVRHVVKDGVSTMEQGSDAYLDWLVRSLKEHEEITVIGMDAAIPDIISLVLRAGKHGIGYQEVRTFTTQDGLGGNKSCLQFRIRRGQGYIALEKRPPRS
ncbi:hypothetical protein BGZ83_006433 [Gryganskiella cystojenkinii]|nr:hypothetical protein BGZ83_006433 [Gryganskiella cystojenkinii]